MWPSPQGNNVIQGAPSFSTLIFHDFSMTKKWKSMTYRLAQHTFPSKQYTTYECIPELVVTVPSARSTTVKKISPVGDWRSTSLEWPWPWFRPYGIPSCITRRPLPTYQISLRSEENFFRKSPLRFWSSSESRDTKTRTNIKNPARSNLDIVL